MQQVAHERCAARSKKSTFGCGSDAGKVDALGDELAVAALCADAPSVQHRDLVRGWQVLSLVGHLSPREASVQGQGEPQSLGHVCVGSGLT